ncbi:MAG: hypothetical protein ACREPX_10200, partial [Rhodanobacteraceae bacterium]
MHTAPLTANQQRVLDFIRRHLERHGHAPSLREIAENLGLSSHSSAQDYIEALVRKGAIERLTSRDKSVHRGLRLPHRPGFDKIRAPAATLLP